MQDGLVIKAIEARLPVSDVRRSATFYSEVLDLQVGTLWPDDAPQFAILSRDGLRLQLGVSDQREIGSCTLCFDVTDAMAWHSRIQAKAHIEWGPEVYFYHRREFAFRDPDGHLIIVSEVTSDPVTCSAD